MPTLWKARVTAGDKVEGRKNFLRYIFYNGLLQPSEGQETCHHSASPKGGRSLGKRAAGLLAWDQAFMKLE